MLSRKLLATAGVGLFAVFALLALLAPSERAAAQTGGSPASAASAAGPPAPAPPPPAPAPRPSGPIGIDQPAPQSTAWNVSWGCDPDSLRVFETLTCTITNVTNADPATLTFSWDFGDGAKATGRTVSHGYARSGFYTVTSSAVDTRGGTGSGTLTIQVLDPPPPTVTPTAPPAPVLAVAPPPAVALPAAPINLQASPLNATSARLNWTGAADNADGYRVIGSQGVMATLPRGSTAYIISGLAPETYVCGLVVAFNAAGSTYSSWACTTTLSNRPLLPAAPQNLRATALDSTSIRIDWATGSTNDDGFVIYDATSGDKVKSMPHGTTSFTLTGLDADGEYCVIVYAVNSSGSSDPSDQACATTPS